MTLRGAEWSFVALGVVLAALVFWTDRTPPLHAGARTTVAITLVDSDAPNLGCALDGAGFGYTCGFHADGRPRPAAKGVLVPCMTLGRQLLLVPDLFGQPAVAQRLAADRRLPRSRRRRFTAECRVHVPGKVRGVRVRFHRNARFGGPQSIWLAVPTSCRIAGQGG